MAVPSRALRIAILPALLLLPTALWAQQTPAPAAPQTQISQQTKVELTAFAGIQSGLDFDDDVTGTQARLHSSDTAGLILDVGVAQDTQLEFLYSRGTGDLSVGGATLADIKVEYLHVGGAYVYPGPHIRPFFVATLGATRFDPRYGGYDSDTRFSLGLGGGVKFFATKNIGVRLDARAFATQVDSDSAVFCVNGACRIHYEGSFLMQYAASLGVVLAF